MFSFNLIFNTFLITCLTESSLGDITLLEDKCRARYLEFIDDDGVVHVLDTKPHQKVRTDLLYARARKDKVDFYLYTRHNDIPEEIRIDNSSTLKNSSFNPNVTTIFVVHGWWGSFNLGPNPLIINAYLESMDVNAIAVDWSQGARNIDYFQSVAKVPDVGKRIANLIKFLNQETGASFDNMHLIGHSLGAHVVGNAGREVENITGAKVARVTGLDPAGPLWSDNPNKIAKTDAKYVEAIHTNGGPFGLGTLKEWGAANFYPNGGVNQPGCNYPPCSHSRSYELFAATVKHNNLIGRKCPDIEAMLLHSCNGEVAPLGNSDLTKSENGVYRVDTGSKEPFNLEKDL